MEVFKLMGSIFVDSGDAEKKIEGVGNKAEGMGSKLKKGIGTAAKWGTALGGAAIAGGTALAGMAKKAADAGDEIHKGSQKMGISTDAYQELDYWAGQNGMSSQDMEKAVGRLNSRMGEAAAGNDKYANALEATGVNMDDVRNGSISTEDAFATSIQTLSGMNNEQEKAALASELFGKKLGRELLPALNDGSLSIEEAKEKAHEMGIVMGEDAVNGAADLTDMMDDAERSFGAIFRQIGEKFMPILVELLDWIVAHMPQIQEAVGTVFDAISTFVMTAVDIFRDYLLPAFQFIYEKAVEIFPAVQEVFMTVFDAISELVTVFVELFTQIWDLYGDNIMTSIKIVWDLIKTIFSTAFDIIMGLVDFFIALFKGDWEGMGKALRDIMETYWGYIQDVFDLALQFIENLLDVAITTFKNIANKIMTAIWDAFKNVWESIKTWTSESWNNLANTVEAFKTKFKAVAQTIFTFLWNGLKNVWSTISGWVSTSFTNVVSTIRGFAGKFLEAGKALFDRLLRGFKNIWTTITGWIDDIFPGLGTTISGFAYKFVNAGKDLFDGVWDGMKSIWSDLSSWVSDKVSWLGDKLAFWKSSNSEMDSGADGSHFTGLSNVPFDGYKAVLHKDEAVLSRRENKQYKKNKGKGSGQGSGTNQTINIYSPDALSPSEIARRFKNTNRELAMGV